MEARKMAKVAKVAIVVLADGETHESLGRLVNALIMAKELKESKDEVKLIFDGGGTKGLAEIAEPSHKAHALYQAVQDRVAGACSYCAAAFGVKNTLQTKNIPLLDEYAQHPSLRNLVAKGFQLITF